MSTLLKSDYPPVPEYDVTVRRAGYARYDVTANTKNAQKLLGRGTYTYEQPEWIKINRDLKHYGYTIEVL